jgi:hypothetical protein
MAVASLEKLSLHGTLIVLGFKPWRVFDTIEQGVHAQIADLETNMKEGVNYLPIPGFLVSDARDSFQGESFDGRVAFYSYSSSNHHATMFAQECLRAAQRRDDVRAAQRYSGE